MPLCIHCRPLLYFILRQRRLELGLCLSWKGQLICLEGGEGGREGGRGGMFNSNPMIPQYLNNNLT